jgi:hypothetical protein
MFSSGVLHRNWGWKRLAFLAFLGFTYVVLAYFDEEIVCSLTTCFISVCLLALHKKLWNKLEEEVSIFLCNLRGKSESLYVCIPTSWPTRCGGIGRRVPKPSLPLFPYTIRVDIFILLFLMLYGKLSRGWIFVLFLVIIAVCDIERIRIFWLFGIWGWP